MAAWLLYCAISGVLIAAVIPWRSPSAALLGGVAAATASSFTVGAAEILARGGIPSLTPAMSAAALTILLGLLLLARGAWLDRSGARPDERRPPVCELERLIPAAAPVRRAPRLRASSARCRGARRASRRASRRTRYREPCRP